MLIVFVIVLLVIGLAIIGSLYSLFLPFFQQLGNIKQYNVAYYGAVSSVERGMLSLRYHGPGFEVDSSGWIDDVSMGNNHDSMGKSDFGALAHGAMYRSLASRTWTIPVAGQGNVPYALRGYDSEDFLTLGYNNLMVYTLDLDQTTDASNYYNDGFIPTRSTNLNTISLYAQLPKKLYDIYDDQLYGNAKLDDRPCMSGCDRDHDRVADDLVIDRSLEGDYGSNSFRIIPRVDVNYVSGTVNVADNLIRESHINQTTITSPTAQWSTYYNPTDSSSLSVVPHNMIAPSAVLTALQTEGFSAIYGLPGVNNVQLSLGLARMLYLRGGALYPFLETKIVTNSPTAPIADLYYHLDGVGRVGDYSVTISIKKPTSDRSLFGSFTIVF